MKLNGKALIEIENDKKVRTQVVLTVALKRLIKAKKRLTGETVSEYLRRAALLRILSEDEEQKDLDKLAKLLIGSVSLKARPEWQTKKKLQKWLRKTTERMEAALDEIISR